MHINGDIENTTHGYVSKSRTTRPWRLYSLPKINTIAVREISNYKGSEKLHGGMSIPYRPIISHAMLIFNNDN